MIGTSLRTMLRAARRLWVRVTLLALLAILAALLAALAGPLIPEALSARIGRDAVQPVLTILASSMLAVTTFSLNVMVTSQQAAASLATPRAHRLLMEDTTTQTVLATFLGAFLFALVALILFAVGAYEGRASVVVFAMTVVVVALVVLAMLRWIDHLSTLGGMDAVIALVEARAAGSLGRRRNPPCLGGQPLGPDMPVAPHEICAPATGHVQDIAMQALSDWADRRDTILQIAAPPGAFVITGDVLARCFSDPGDDAPRLAAAFRLEQTRSFEQDVRYGLMVLAEIATRALSPGVNDPATAIDVIGRLERLLWEHGTSPAPPDAPAHPRIRVAPVVADDLMEDAYAAIARDGAGMVEVGVRLCHALDRLETGPEDLATAARRMRRRLLDHAGTSLPTASDRARLGL